MRRVAAIPAILCLLTLAACFGSDRSDLQGYVEGTYVYLGAETAGRLIERPVVAGQRIAEGDVLFKLDDSDQNEAVAGAEARLAQAKAQLADLQTGKRDAEIGVIAAQLSEARATEKNAEDDYSRKLLLRKNNVVAQAAVDDAKAKRDIAAASTKSIERQLDVAKLPARPEEIAAAERNVTAQEAALAQSRIALERRVVTAPAEALVEETFYSPGELVGAGQPVVSLLPEANRKIRFFLPETSLAEIAIGDPVSIGCDRCPEGLTARIDFIATEAEFTPPVLYSEKSRGKLVYRVEARPVDAALKVGQPVDISLGAKAGS
jgi:HlyD family secretion protein